MTREEVYKEIEGVFGLVPSFFKPLPDSSLEIEWRVFKSTLIEDSVIPHKYRELIALGESAASKCQYCIFYHTEVAKLFGATDEEIEEAVRIAKTTTGWSTYINGMQVDLKQFKDEVRRAVKHVREMQAVPA